MQHEYISFLLVYYSIYFAASIIALALKNKPSEAQRPHSDLLIVLGLIFVSVPFSLLYSFQPVLFLCSLALDISLLVVSKKAFKNYSYAGANFYIANFATILIGILWGYWFLTSLPVSLTTKLLLIITAPLLLISIPSGILQLLEQYDVVCREVWVRPRRPFPTRADDVCVHEPFVSIHVPTYSEPPALVIETLDILSKLDYTNYEVVVIDNNTKDSSLWMPVRSHCKDLGRKFKFFHVDNLQGAKGGALNVALKKISSDATLIGVVDADYHADPQFLKALVGYFDDAKVGFVQTPHDYRAWQQSAYLTMCYWEYKIFFHTIMVSLNERNAGLTVGTMCIIRKEALEKAGGWSEWCVTEDSELAIRIHDVGYSSVYVDTTYGRGLIPETFGAYKKQRYRWTAGPIQEFQHHFGHFFGLTKKPSSFTLTQRIFHINHGLVNTILGLGIPVSLLTIATIISMVFHHEIIAVPFELWLVATILLFASPALTWLVYKKTVHARFRDIVGQVVAYKALTHTITYSALRTFITGNAAWVRTNKFKSRSSYAAVMSSTTIEFAAGLSIAVFIVVSYHLLPYPGLALMLLIGLSYISINYFAAPLMGLINVWSIKRNPPSKQSLQEL